MANLLNSLVRPIRFERTASTSGVLRSIQLSYGRVIDTLLDGFFAVNRFPRHVTSRTGITARMRFTAVTANLIGTCANTIWAGCTAFVGTLSYWDAVLVD
jgi:hypothetical protein